MANKKMITFLKGWPALSLLPVKRLATSVLSTFEDTPEILSGLCYGPDPGYEPLRTAIANWLSENYSACQLDVNRLVITGGASQNLANILQVYTDPIFTKSVFILSPSYMMVFPIFEDNGLGRKMVAIPEDDEGIDIEYLERMIQSRNTGHPASDMKTLKPLRNYSKYYAHILYCVPTFSNPSGRTMSLRRRGSLVRVARQYDILLISDDVYDHLHWNVVESEWHNDSSEGHIGPLRAQRALLPRLVDIDRELEEGAQRFGNAVSNGSFSKICGPGVRCGWAEGTRSFATGLAKTGATRSGGAPSQLTSTYLTKLIVSGDLQLHIAQELIPAYQRRRNKMLRAVQKHLSPLGVINLSAKGHLAGGFFLWCQLPEAISADSFAQRCGKEEDVIIAPGNLFRFPGDVDSDYDRNIRLCYSWVDESLIAVGIDRMAKVLRSMQEDISLSAALKAPKTREDKR